MIVSSRTSLRVAAVAVVFIAICTPVRKVVAMDYQITDIKFTGNEKTRPETLLRELSFRSGMMVSAAEIAKGRESIMALGLFTTVQMELFRAETGYALWINVREKYFFLPVPILNLSGDGDWTYGIMSRTENLFGLNQQLKISYRRKLYHHADIEREKRLQFSYQTPQVSNSGFGLELGLYREQALLDEARMHQAGRYERRLIEGRVTLSRWLRLIGPSQGWRMSVGLRQQAYEHTLLSGDADLFFNTRVLTILTRLENKMVVTRVNRRTGQHYGYELQKARASMGRTIIQHFGFYRIYKDLGVSKLSQLHARLRLGACSGTVFGDRCFSLGGVTTIRGARRDSLAGDAFILTNMQL